MQQPAGISAQKWIWRAMVRSALVPLVLVETVLIAAYLISNNMIRDANMSYLYQKVDSELQIVTQQAADVIHEQLLAVSRQAEIYRTEVQRVLTNEHFLVSDAEKANYALSPKGVFHSVKDLGGAASFYSAATPAEKQNKEKVWRLSQLDPLMQQIKMNNPLIAAVYFNSWDSYNRIYPWFFTPEQYPADMVIPDYNFYYLADQKNNPLRTVSWTDVYIDPAGNGWMASCIAPVYNGDFLEGVIGLDITVETIIEKIQRLQIPWRGYAILVNNNGNIMALPPEGEKDFGLRELTTHSYQEAIKKEIFKPEKFNLFLREDLNKTIFDIKNKETGNGELQLKGKNKIISWNTIPGIRWKLITIVDENQLYAETNSLAKQFEQIGYLMIIGLIAFYVIFIGFIWFSSRSISKAVSEPLLHMKGMVDRISKEEYQLDSPAFPLAELRETALAIVDMGQKLDNITHDLRKAKEDADEANKAKSLFLSCMSHELRTPLNAILGFGQLLQRSENSLTDRERQDYIDEIMTAGHHLLRLIDDVLSLSRLETKGPASDIEPIDIIRIINACSDMLRPMAVKEQLTLRVKLPQTVILVMADATRVRQVLLNFISNAIKYNKPNGVIDIYAELKDHFLRINVRDSGQGIPADKQKDIFTPFSRLGNETSGIQGNGIGLAISKHLAESMNGQIGFSSQEDAGSVFWVDIPLAENSDISLSELMLSVDEQQEDTTQSGTDGAEEGAPLNVHSALCINCDPDLVGQLIRLAAKNNTAIASVTTAGDALNMLKRSRPDLIIVKAHPDDMDAYILLEKLRQTDMLKFIPVVLVTNEIFSVTQHTNSDLAFDYVLISPVDVLHAWAVIQKMLNYAPK